MYDRAVICDLTEFVANPVRTGIQRVTYEIVSRWPSTRPLLPARVSADGKMTLLPASLIGSMKEHFNSTSDADASRLAIARYGKERGQVIGCRDLRKYHAIINTEIFFDDVRVGFYLNLLRWYADRTFVVFYDWLPWLHPECFAHGAPLGTMNYLKFARQVRRTGFISNQTKLDYLKRILREERPVGPVLPLGSDALGTASPRFSPDKRGFVCLGTIEPRKNHNVILDAFAGLWEAGVDASLTFIGNMGWVDDGLRRRIEGLKLSEPRFEWLSGLPDNEVGERIKASRATIYISNLEGYGLPPMESMALGVPVIVCEEIPSISMLEPYGQLRLVNPDKENLGRAVLKLLDDGYAMRKHEEISNLQLPTWNDLSRKVADWVEYT